MQSCLYYEWYVPVDEDHYTYFQVATAWPGNPLSRLWFEVKYYLFGRPFKMILFNNQDVRMVAQTTNYTKRRGIDYLTPLTRQDLFHIEWRRHCNLWARGEGSEWRKQALAAALGAPELKVAKRPEIAGGSEG
jgi:hypothetical protein